MRRVGRHAAQAPRHAEPAEDMEDMEEEPAEEEEDDYDPQRDNYEWLRCIVMAIVACVLLFVLVARVIDVQGRSMEPTLYERDKLIITRLAGDYEYGDIVVLQKDSFKPEPIVKRVIAMEGQTVTINFAEGIVYVDGKALDEPYTKERTYERSQIMDPANYEVYGIDPKKDVTADSVTVTVPEGCVFVMGDNRNNSNDSRHADVNFVDTRLIMGKAVFRIYPFDRIGAIYGPDSSDG